MTVINYLIEIFRKLFSGNNPGQKPSEPGHKPSEPGHKPSDIGHKPADPGEKPTDPGHKPADPGHKPSEPGHKPADPGHKPAGQTPKVSVPKPYTIQTIPFLTSKLKLNYDGSYVVKYSINDSDKDEFPIIRAPKKGCDIKLPVEGRNGKRGACEKILCDVVQDFNLPNFYDNLSLLVGKLTRPFEPDLAYVDASKGIFIDIEVDEPYSGWERTPIHYKTNNGTSDDLRNCYFTERGWTVIRFSENQVKKQTKSCLKRIYQLLQSMDNSIVMPVCFNSVADIIPDNMWTENMAKQKAARREREELLGISEFIEPSEEGKSVVKDYPQGSKIEQKISNKRAEVRKPRITEIGPRPFAFPHSPLPQSPSTPNTPQSPPIVTSNSDEQRRKEAERYERPQHVSTQSKPTTTPSSRGYA